MDGTDFTRAAFDPAHRPKLVAALKGDPILRGLARVELDRLSVGQRDGMLLDRCHISRVTYQMLTDALRQVAQDSAPPATVETKESA